MVVIVGSKSATPKVTELVSKNYRDLTKYYKRDEINALESWIQKQPHLPRLTGDHLLVFLHAANYSVERAKELIDNYCTYRTRAPQIFKNRTPDSVFKRAFEIAYFVIMPETCKSCDGSQIMVLRLRDPDPAKADFVEGVKTTFALYDLYTGKYPLSKGLEVIMDMEGLVLGHLGRIDFPALKVFMTYLQDALPTVLKAVYVVNTFSLINQIMTLIKPFINIELLKKISFYTPNEFNKLTDTKIKLENLPSNYGGSAGSLDELQEETFKQLHLATDWLQELESFRVDESKRLGKRRSDMNVCDGSFKKLEID